MPRAAITGHFTRPNNSSASVTIPRRARTSSVGRRKCIAGRVFRTSNRSSWTISLYARIHRVATGTAVMPAGATMESSALGWPERATVRISTPISTAFVTPAVSSRLNAATTSCTGTVRTVVPCISD